MRSETVSPRLVSVAPPVMPISLAEAKQHLRVLHDTENALIERLLRTALQHLEGVAGRGGILGRFVAAQTIAVTWPSAAAGGLRFSTPPVRAVVGLVIGATPVPADAWLADLDSDDAVTVTPLAPWPTGPATLTLDVGYLDCPEPLRAAMLLLIAHWYSNRDAAGSKSDALPFGVKALLSAYQTHGWI